MEGKRKVESLGYLLILGLEMLLICFGATVLVPIICGIDISVVLFSAGIATIFFHYLTKYRSANGAVPIFLGSSFAYIPAILGATKLFGLPATFFGLGVAGLGKIIFSRLIKFWGSEKIKNVIFPPVVIGSIIAVIGLNLTPVALKMSRGDAELREIYLQAQQLNAGQDMENAGAAKERIEKKALKIGYVVPEELKKLSAEERSSRSIAAVCADREKIFSTERHAPLFAVLTLIAAIIVMVYFKGIFKLLPVLIAIAFGYLLILIFGHINFSPLTGAAWIGLPHFTMPKVSIPAAIYILPFVIAPVIEHFGDIMAVGGAVGKDFFKSPGVDRTMLGDGVGTMFGGLIGAVPNTSYSEGVSALNILGLKNPRIMLTAGIFALAFSFIQKLNGFLQTIPTCVIGGIMVVIFGGIAVIGLQTYVRERVDFHKTRNIIIAAIMLVVGIGDVKFNWGNITLSGIGLSAVLGVILNLALPKDRE